MTQAEAGGEGRHDPLCPHCGGSGRTGPAGTCLRASGKDGPQIVRSGGRRWTDEAEEIFLDALAATCNVTAAAERTGFSKEAIYRRRRSDPAFAARWAEALAQGVARLDMLLVRTAEDYLEGRAPDPDSPFASMTVRDAIAILKLHKPGTEGQPARYPGWRGRPRTMDEMRASILAKFDAIERQERASGGEA
jgi:hypothetical protein